MERCDLLIVGGGINGTAIARDAAGRGLSVLLVEKDDLASHTSSASSKLIHGGLRYLEQYEFRLVHEALHERQVLLRTAPHLVRPLRFVLPHPGGRRPWWLVRLGLRLYDLLAGRRALPGSEVIGEDGARFRTPLKPSAAQRLATYWDAWVDDARLVALNAVDAAERGARIATRTTLVSAERVGGHWSASLSDARTVEAGAIVNAAGPWVAEVLGQRLHGRSASKVRLVKGSHIVLPSLYAGDHAYILQQPDGRVVFAIPYEGCFTLVGTTDVQVSAPEDARIDDGEIAYLCAAVNRYFTKPVTPGDIVWHYSGVRSLYDDGAPEAKAVTRDYHLELDDGEGAPLLSLFGGKITTARALAEEALEILGVKGGRWTAASPIPGGDFAAIGEVEAPYPWMPSALRSRLARAYGTRIRNVVGKAANMEDLGRAFGADLYEAELRYLVTNEYARTAEDVLWRRTKCGLFMTASERDAVASFLDEHFATLPR